MRRLLASGSSAWSQPTTHLPMRPLIDMPIQFIGQKVVMHMDIVITGIDKRVPIASVG
jgi:hypothetical protein